MMGLSNHIGFGETEQVIVALKVTRPVFELFTAIIGLGEFIILDLGTHGSIDDHDALRQDPTQDLFCVGHDGSCDEGVSEEFPSCDLTKNNEAKEKRDQI